MRDGALLPRHVGGDEFDQQKPLVTLRRAQTRIAGSPNRRQRASRDRRPRSGVPHRGPKPIARAHRSTASGSRTRPRGARGTGPRNRNARSPRPRSRGCRTGPTCRFAPCARTRLRPTRRALWRRPRRQARLAGACRRRRRLGGRHGSSVASRASERVVDSGEYGAPLGAVPDVHIADDEGACDPSKAEPADMVHVRHRRISGMGKNLPEIRERSQFNVDMSGHRIHAEHLFAVLEARGK